MAQLTEKETTIEIGAFKAEFLAEYSNNKPTRILLSIEADGYPLIWGHNKFSLHEVFSGFKQNKTDEFRRLEHFLNPELYKKIETELNKLIQWKKI